MPNSRIGAHSTVSSRAARVGLTGLAVAVLVVSCGASKGSKKEMRQTIRTLEETVSRLEQRIKELETTVEVLKAANQTATAPAPPAPSLTPPAPAPAQTPGPTGAHTLPVVKVRPWAQPARAPQAAPVQGNLQHSTGDRTAAVNTLPRGSFIHVEADNDEVSDLDRLYMEPGAATRDGDMDGWDTTDAGALEPDTDAAPAVSEESQFDEAHRLFRDQEYAGAADAFRDYLRQYPSSERAEDAHYWIGESLMAQHEFETAAQQYATLVMAYPNGAKAPDALYRMAVCYHKQGRSEQARAALSQLEELYPYSTAAQTAQPLREQLDE